MKQSAQARGAQEERVLHVLVGLRKAG